TRARSARRTRHRWRSATSSARCRPAARWRSSRASRSSASCSSGSSRATTRARGSPRTTRSGSPPSEASEMTTMNDALILDGIRAASGKDRAGRSAVRPDDRAANVNTQLLARNEGAREHLEEIIFGNTNQAGEDNRNVARMALLLAGLPYEVTGVTVNRLCGSGMEALVQVSRAIEVGDLDVAVAGGVESMTRAPYTMPKADEPFPRRPPPVYDTSLGWRFENPRMKERFPLISMGETAENVADEHGISRADQDAFALASQQKAAAAWEAGRFADEVVPVVIPPANKKAQPGLLDRDESVRPDTTLEKLAALKPVFRKGGTVTAGNSSPLN